MAWDVSGLTNYVDQTSQDLITAAVISSETSNYLTPMTGVKYQKAIQLLDVDMIPQDLGCAFTPTGSDTLTQRVMTVYDVNFHKQWCPKDLETKWTQILLSPGSKYDEADVPAAIIDEIMKQVGRRLETADWQGNTGAGSAYLNTYNGIIKIVEDAGTYVSPTGSGSTTFSAANSRTILQACLDAIPDALKGDSEFRFFCSYDFFQMYINKLSTDNLFHKSGEDFANWEINIENTPVKLKAVHGLDGITKIFGFRTSNVFLGMDLEGDSDNVELWYSKDDRKVNFALDMKRGIQVAYPAEVVRFSQA